MALMTIHDPTLPGNLAGQRNLQTLFQDAIPKCSNPSAQTQVLKHLQAANANASPGLRAF
jgi:hypothetical protein